MKLLLAFWLGSAAALHAITAACPLTFVTQPGFNVMTISIIPQGLSGLGDSDTTTLTGSVTAQLDINPKTGKTSELTLSNGRVNGTNMNFSRSIFLVGGYNFNVTNFSAALNTTSPPGVVDPGTGQFDASQHRFDVDQGAITGSTNGIIGNNTINEAFTPANPASGNGTGTGTVTLGLVGDSGIYRVYNVTVTLPVTIADTFDAGGLLVDVTATGTLKATGTVQVPRTEYLAWTAAQSTPGVSFQADSNGDGVPNGLAWALGLGAGGNARAHLPAPDPATPGAFLLTLPAGGTGGALLVESSSNLSDWEPAVLPPGMPNPIPAGTTGTIVIPPAGSGLFVRVSAAEP